MRTALILLIALLCSKIYAQDLIVTKSDDSLNCKITKVKKDYVYFIFKHENEVRRTLLPVSDVETYSYNFFKKGEVEEKDIKNFKGDYKRLRIALNAGFGYQIAKIADNIPEDFRAYTKELKSGFQFGADASFFISEFVGFGIKYRGFNSKNELANVSIEQSDGSRRFGKLSDNINVSFIGPQISTRYLNHNAKNALIVNLSLGYLGYSNNSLVVDSFKTSGSTLGLVYDIGYEIGISKHLSIGVQASILSGRLSKIEIEDETSTQTISLEKDQRENLSRLDFSIGLIFHK